MKGRIFLVAIVSILAFTGTVTAKIIAENAVVDFTSGITFDPANPDKQPEKFTPGERITASVSTSRLSDCGGCTISWSSDNPGVVFINQVSKSYSQEATMVINSDITLGKNVEIKVTTSHSGTTREVKKQIMIGSNTAPTAKPVFLKEVSSFSSFNVDCRDSLSGKDMNEAGDRVWRCKVTVLDEKGVQIDSPKEKTVKPGDNSKLIVSVKSGATPVNKVIVEIEDTMGAVSVYNGMINVVEGPTGKDQPVITIKSYFNCGLNTTCSLSAADTLKLYPNTAGFIWEEITNGITKPIRDQQGRECRTEICNAFFNTSGVKTGQVRAHLSGKTKEDKKIFYINVNGVQTSTRAGYTPSTMPQTTGNITAGNITATISGNIPVPRGNAGTQISDKEICEKNPDRCKKSPDIGFTGGIFAMLVVILARKLR